MWGRRRRRQCRQQHDRGRARRRRVHRRQYRCPGAHQFEGRARHPDGHAGDRRPRRRRAAGCGARGGGRGHRGGPRPIGRRAHGVHYRRHGRRHRHGRCPHHRQDRARARHSHHRRRHQAIPVRGPAPHALCRSRHRGAAEGGGHPPDHPEPEPVPGRQREDHVRGCLRHGRSGALFGRGLHQRPHRQGRSDQSRFCRRSLGHARKGQGHDGQGRGFRPEARAQCRYCCDFQSIDRGSLDQARQRPDRLHHRRQGPDAVRGRRGRDPHPRRGRSGRQHHRRRHLRCQPRWCRPRLGRGDRHRQSRLRAREAAGGQLADGPCRPAEQRPAPHSRPHVPPPQYASPPSLIPAAATQARPGRSRNMRAPWRRSASIRSAAPLPYATRSRKRFSTSRSS